MQQYFIQGIIDPNCLVNFDQEQLHHIRNVLKMKPQQQLRLVDEAQKVYLAKLVQQEDTWCAEVIEALPTNTSDVSIVLAAALIKKERWDWLLQKCSELGVSEIHGFTATRCVVKWKSEEKAKKLKRWNKITSEACEQCHRSDLVPVFEPLRIQQLCEMKADVKLIAYERADQEAHMLSLLPKYRKAKRILAVIGPEGGFTSEEIDQFMQAGFQCVSLGKRILRAETAAISIVNLLSMYYENEIRGVTNEEYRGNPQ